MRKMPRPPLFLAFSSQTSRYRKWFAKVEKLVYLGTVYTIGAVYGIEEKEKHNYHLFLSIIVIILPFLTS